MPVSAHLNDVYVITDRPDLVNETTAALNRALRRAHFVSDFFPDIASTLVPNANSVEFQVALPARFRKVHSIDGPDFHVHEITPGALYDSDVLVPKENCYYLAGSQVNFSVRRRFQNLKFQYFRFPTFDDSFIIQNFYEAVTYQAAAIVFASINQNDSAKRWAEQASQVYAELVTSHFVVQQS